MPLLKKVSAHTLSGQEINENRSKIEMQKMSNDNIHCNPKISYATSFSHNRNAWNIKW